jgi:hypothetical protein
VSAEGDEKIKKVAIVSPANAIGYPGTCEKEENKEYDVKE